jgi:uncharacterized protein
MAKASAPAKGKSKAGSSGKNRSRPIKKSAAGGAARKKAAQQKTSGRKSVAPKKPASSRPKGRKAGKAGHAARAIPRVITTCLVLIGFLIMAAAGAYVLINPEGLKAPMLENLPASGPKSPDNNIKSPKAAKTAKAAKAAKTAKAVKPAAPLYEVFPAAPELMGARVTSVPVHREPSAPGRRLPKVAIIIDDMGHDKKIAEKFFSLNASLTYSVLPYSRFCRDISDLAVQKGYEVMLHLPMEPNEYPDVDPGPGALTVAMTPDERIGQLKRNLSAVAHIKGVNNHMGSRLTALSDEMNQVFSILKQRELFFIDSRTTAATQTKSSAKLFKVPYAERDVFLDHVQNRKMIRRQIDALVNIAEIHGKAVAIGHPHHMTYEVLSEMLPGLQERVELVFASEIVEVF